MAISNCKEEPERSEYFHVDLKNLTDLLEPGLIQTHIWMVWALESQEKLIRWPLQLPDMKLRALIEKDWDSDNWNVEVCMDLDK